MSPPYCAVTGQERPQTPVARTHYSQPRRRVKPQRYPRGRPRPRPAMMPRWISEVPAAIVVPTLVT